MRRLAIAAQNLHGIDIVLIQVAMRIAGHRDRQIRAGQSADFLQDVEIAAADPFNIAGPMQMQINLLTYLKIHLLHGYFLSWNLLLLLLF